MSGSKRHNKNEKTVTVWKKIFGMQKINQDQYSKQTFEATNQKVKENNQVEKQKKDMKRKLIEEEAQVANKHMKKCSVSLEIRKMQIRVTKRYHFSVFRLGKMYIVQE